jgi:hypothetical protein
LANQGSGERSNADIYSATAVREVAERRWEVSVSTQLFLLGLAFIAALVWGVRSYDRMQYRKRTNQNLMRHCRRMEERDIRGRL